MMKRDRFTSCESAPTHVCSPPAIAPTRRLARGSRNSHGVDSVELSAFGYAGVVRGTVRKCLSTATSRLLCRPTRRERTIDEKLRLFGEKSQHGIVLLPGTTGLRPDETRG